MTYNRFMQGLKLAGIELDRRVLAELAVNEPAAFAALVETARAAVAAAPATGGRRRLTPSPVVPTPSHARSARAEARRRACVASGGTASMIELLTERSARIVAARKLTRRAGRDAAGLFLAEGRQAVAEALADPDGVREVFATEAAAAAHRDLLAATAGPRPAGHREGRGRAVGDGHAPGPGRRLRAARRRRPTPLSPQPPRLAVALAELADPGNAGTVLRTADACGAGAVVFGAGSADPYGGKAVRASAGSLFHVDVVRGAPLRAADAGAAGRRRDRAGRRRRGRGRARRADRDGRWPGRCSGCSATRRGGCPPSWPRWPTPGCGSRCAAGRRASTWPRPPRSASTRPSSPSAEGFLAAEAAASANSFPNAVPNRRMDAGGRQEGDAADFLGGTGASRSCRHWPPTRGDASTVHADRRAGCALPGSTRTAVKGEGSGYREGRGAGGRTRQGTAGVVVSHPDAAHPGSHAGRPVSADGRRSRWTEHRRARREELVAAAVEAVRAAGPDFAVDDVARSAGVSKTVIYRYFTDKDELVDAVLERISDAVLLPRLLGELGASTPTTAPRLRAVIAAFVALIEDEPELYRFAYAHAGRSGRADLVAATEREIAEALAARHGRAAGRRRSRRPGPR